MRQTSPPAIEVTDLTVRFGDFTAVDRVSFSVARGEVFGFLGANGAGKTTVIRTLCGLLLPTEGAASVAGLGFEDGGTAIKSKVGYMSQRFTLYDDLTAGENLAFAAGLRRLGPAALQRRTKELLDFIGFDRSLDTLVRDLAGGLKQELALAASLLHDPEIVFLDEPTSGVAPAARERFWNLIARLTRSGKTVLVTTHYMDEAERCGRIALMAAGRLIALDSPAGLKASVFPGPMAEVDPAGSDPAAVRGLASAPGVLSLKPHGTRFHLALSDEAAWKSLSASVPPGAHARRIAPSLEDVFLRLVEAARDREVPS
ncbi:MAG: ABC transporter ATP-binding protein [Elusimicrobia bacterium]|nr:ABC transporter ATP-binding protein [Elusimicrobiota bacterium]